jgi:Ca2+-binding RTX toxin-like protein
MNNIISFSASWDTTDNTLDGGLGQDEMHGGAGNDKYYVDDEQDLAIEEDAAFGTQDVVFASVNYTIGDHIETLSLAGNAVSGTGNAQSNTIFGNAQDNELDGGGSSDSLSGLGGNDTFVFKAGQANGDVVFEFAGNGAGVGDSLKFVGYGPGATFTQQTATEWFITSADGSIQEVITLVGAPSIDATDYVFV